MSSAYCRWQSPTQTPEDAKKQELTGEIWGHPARNSLIPKVKAYVGQLRPFQLGIEFTTTVNPDDDVPPGYAYWSGPRPGVVVQDDCAKIKVTVVKNTQRD